MMMPLFRYFPKNLKRVAFWKMLMMSIFKTLKINESGGDDAFT